MPPHADINLPWWSPVILPEYIWIVNIPLYFEVYWAIAGKEGGQKRLRGSERSLRLSLPPCMRKESMLRRRFSRREAGTIQAIRIRFNASSDLWRASISRKSCRKWMEQGLDMSCLCAVPLLFGAWGEHVFIWRQPAKRGSSLARTQTDGGGRWRK